MLLCLLQCEFFSRAIPVNGRGRLYVLSQLNCPCTAPALPKMASQTGGGEGSSVTVATGANETNLRKRRSGTPDGRKQRRRDKKKNSSRRSSSPVSVNERRFRRTGDDHFAIEIGSPGGYEKLKVVRKKGAGSRGPNIAMMNVPEDQLVEIATDYCGVNYADVCVRWGLYESAKKFVGWPIVPGFEFSGTVLKVGSATTGLNVGDKVFGVTMFGGYSNSVVVPRAQVFPVPDELKIEEAAAFPCVALTAWYAMFKLYQPHRGQSILVHSAAGGVGSMLVQLGKIAGLKVVGVVGSSHKVQYANDLGCDLVIDKSKEDLWDRAKDFCPAGFDAIFDANGYTTLSGSYSHLCPAGRLIVYGFHSMLPRVGGKLDMCAKFRMIWGWLTTPRFNPLDMTAANKSLLCFNLSFLFNKTEILQEAMDDLLSHVKNGSLIVPKVVSFPMSRVASAHERIESGLTVGKLVLNTKQIV